PTVTVAQTTTAPESTATAALPTTPVDTPAPTTDAATSEAATTAAPTPTLAQTTTAEPEATDAPLTFVVEEPVAGASWSSGDTVTLAGRAPSGAISASLRAAGLLLDSAETTPSSAGAWQMSLDIPTT